MVAVVQLKHVDGGGGEEEEERMNTLERDRVQRRVQQPNWFAHKLAKSLPKKKFGLENFENSFLRDMAINAREKLNQELG